MRTSTDEKSDEVTLDSEGLARQLALSGIASHRVLRRVRRRCKITRRRSVRVNGSLTLHRGFADMGRNLRFGHWPLAKGRALHFPTFVGWLLKILEDNIRTSRFSSVGIHRLANQHDGVVVCHHRIGTKNPWIDSDRVDEHRVFQPATDLRLDRLGGCVFQPVTHDGGGIARVIVVERTKGRVGLQGHLHRTVWIRVAHGAKGISTGENHLFPILPIKGANLLFAIDRDL